MAIGIDEDFDDSNVNEFENDTLTENDDELRINNSSDYEDDIISELLKEKGISDLNKIKFESDSGEIEERNWNSLDKNEKIEILKSSDDYVQDSDNDLSDDEMELLNTIRENKMSPREYILNIQMAGINRYILNLQIPEYSIDQYDDDTLFCMDVLARLGDENVTDEELENILENAKSNPTLYTKQVQSLRSEYKNREDENRKSLIEMQRQNLIEKYNRFAEKIESEIRNFKNFGGFDLNMDESEQEEIYDFLTSFDGAGISVFSKALNDPKLLVKMAWFALNGEKAFEDINNYWINELKNNRRLSTSLVEIATNNRKNKNYSSSIDDDFI